MDRIAGTLDAATSTGERATMSLIRNERTKYFATLVNTVAAAVIAAGLIAPLVALTYGLPGPLSTGPVGVVVGVAWLVLGMLLHLAVRLILRGLRE